jgi:hypothetical protein
MDFDAKNPAHVITLILFLFVLFFVFITPILSFFDISTGDIEITETTVIISSIITVLILIGMPFLWFLLVNNYNIRTMLDKLRLRSERIDDAFLWGVLAAAVMLIIVLIIGSALYSSGVVDEDTEISNIEDLAGNLSIYSMVFIILFQSIGEEIFFRGFLMEKINSYAGEKMAIFVTAILFGLAHMSYGKIYPVIMPMIMGIILGYIVFRTKNLYSAIIAHMLFNFTSFALYLFTQSLEIESLIL